MYSKHGVLCYKIVTSEQVDVDNVEFPKVSKAVQQVIREARLDSMQGLLGKDWQDAARQLARDYWSVK